ncbi:PREDICTED: uncharacterized protein LOC109462846 [Branchiostoma belcheri]|uniref:Uncharacterized protein LOC109462846 n=1 Tax=Branchiostoma belcheri TaxID=7741 RepID=A0A6P4YDP3_BRABE|nr:PREDICTED: uncharacterized protein LOC109462846 [Branchiostoma belcheri]
MRRNSEFPACLIISAVTAMAGLACFAAGLAGKFGGSVLLCLVGGHVLFLALGFGLFWYLLNIPSKEPQEDDHIVLDPDHESDTTIKPTRNLKENAFFSVEPNLLAVVKGYAWPVTNSNNNNNNDSNMKNNNLVLMETVV